MEERKKKIYFELAGRPPSQYKGLVSYPPEGYEFITKKTSWDKLLSPVINNSFAYFFLARSFRYKVPLPLTLIKARLESLFKRPPKGIDLTYAWNHLVFRREPWILDLEWITALLGFNVDYLSRYRKLIEKSLALDYCKKILCWTEFTKRGVLTALDCSKFEHKLEVVYRAVPAKDFVKKYNESKVKLLFVGTANEPEAFELKGGKEVLEAFTLLRKKYTNLELVIRSDVPKYIKNKYEGVEGLRIIEEVIPWSSLEQEFKSADIFLFPTHITPAMVFLDAMSYELPIVTVDEEANAEIVENGKTGFAVKGSRAMPSFFEIITGDKQRSQWHDGIRIVDSKVVEELVEKTSLLIENKELRRRMGKTARWEVEEGKFSIKKRNKKLKRIFNEATAK